MHWWPFELSLDTKNFQENNVKQNLWWLAQICFGHSLESCCFLLLFCRRLLIIFILLDKNISSILLPRWLLETSCPHHKVQERFIFHLFQTDQSSQSIWNWHQRIMGSNQIGHWILDGFKQLKVRLIFKTILHCLVAIVAKNQWVGPPYLESNAIPLDTWCWDQLFLWQLYQHQSLVTLLLLLLPFLGHKSLHPWTTEQWHLHL